MILNQIITMYIGLLVMKSYINANNMTNIDNAKTQNFKNVIVSISCLFVRMIHTITQSLQMFIK